MGYVSKEYLKENGYILFRYQKSEDGSEGVLPVNIDDLPEVDGIIHCKDCAFYEKEIGGNDGFALGMCRFIEQHYVTNEGFCFWAKKRGDLGGTD